MYERIKNYILPLFLTVLSFGALLKTAWVMIRQKPTKLLSYSTWNDVQMNTIWSRMGGNVDKLYVGLKQDLIQHASGVCVEYGPGWGHNLKYLDKSKVTKLFLVEPNENMIPKLKEEVDAAGLTAITTIINAPAQDIDALYAAGLNDGQVDSIIFIMVLCSVPNSDYVLKRMYKLLKPGGQFLFLEHVQSTSWISQILQFFYSLYWPIVCVFVFLVPYLLN